MIMLFPARPQHLNLTTPGLAECPRYLVDGPTIYSLANGVQSTDPVEIYNWQDEVYVNGFSQKFGASASGGSDNGNYYISAGFDNQEGVVKNSSFKSSDIRINLNQKLNDNLQLKAPFLSTGNAQKPDF